MDNEQEILLNHSEIKSIEKFVSENVINTGKDFKTVYKVSPIKGLIFIKGNEHTGFEHINQRHNFWSKRPFKKGQNSNEERLDNPSKFRSDSIPIFDYLKIAEAIFSSSNLNIELNKRPNLFDYYTGEYFHPSNQMEKYILLTYKGSKIVHSLFPKTKKNNTKKTKHFNFQRGNVSAKLNIANDILEISIPYLNSRNIVLYTILIRRNNISKIEKAFIISHNKKGEQLKSLYLGERDLVKVEDVDKLLTGYEFTDLTYFEKQILNLEKHK